jgi:hypothetical protein
MEKFVLREGPGIWEPVIVLLYDLVILGEADCPDHDNTSYCVKILFSGASPPLVALNHELAVQKVVVHVSIAYLSCIKVVGYEERTIRIMGLENYL